MNRIPLSPELEPKPSLGERLMLWCCVAITVVATGTLLGAFFGTAAGALCGLGR